MKIYMNTINKKIKILLKKKKKMFLRKIKILITIS